MTVYLVGAGPGDPALLSKRAQELIAEADVIVHDRLIPPEALEHAGPHAEVIYAGKEGGGASASQEEIERLLVERGRRGQTVVRLKGGDPFVFGRGGEEVQALVAAGVACEVVPGITAGVAAPAAAGIPVTHRGVASAVAFVTGHEDPEKPEHQLDWRALARFPGTLVIYMAIRQLGSITAALIAAGRDPDEPVAVIERGTLPDQRVLEGTLQTVSGLGARAPAIVVLGPVAELRRQLPLAGVRIAITRARAQSSSLAARLRALGADVVPAPAIRIVPLAVELPELSRYDLICLTSPNGVRLLFARLAEVGLDARVLAQAKVAAIGPGTASALRRHGVIADVVPERFVAEGLVEALRGMEVRRALIAGAADARDVLERALAARGADVDVLALYRTVAESLSAEQLEAVRDAGYLTFTSSSTVRFLLEAMGDRELGSARIVSIGPATTATLHQHGLEPDVEAVRHDIDGLVEALLADATRGGTPGRP